MKLTILSAVIALSSVTAKAREYVPEHCANSSQQILYTSDFHWSYELADLITRFAEIYESSKRLGQHAYLDPSSGQFKFPYEAARGGDVHLPLTFVASVRRHIEEALRLQYIDAVFFPDMGHSHFLVPLSEWDSKYDGISTDKFSFLYEQMMSDPDLKILYHTAEQLRMRDDQQELLKDRRVQERFYTRNLVGDNRAEGRLEILQNREQSMNTVSEVAGYRWWGAGFNVSANKNGCFAYLDHGMERFFDISLYDLEPPPEQDASLVPAD